MNIVGDGAHLKGVPDKRAGRPCDLLAGKIVYMQRQRQTIQEHAKCAHSRQKHFLPLFAVEKLLRRQVAQLEANPWDVVPPQSTLGTLLEAYSGTAVASTQLGHSSETSHGIIR